MVGYFGKDGEYASIDFLTSRGLIEIQRDTFLTNVDISLKGKLVLPLEIIPTKNSLRDIKDLEVSYDEPEGFEDKEYFEIQKNVVNILEKGV